MTTKRRLPVLVEESISSIRALRTDLSVKFEAHIRNTERHITCSSGCVSCCYHPVTISIAEGILLYRWLKAHNQWTTALRAKLQEVADRQYGTSYEVWLMALIPCPLLSEQKKCSAYAARPLICRSYYAVSDPHYCHPHRLGPNTRIVDRAPVIDPFHLEQERILRRHHIQFLTMPIGAAVLMGSRVCNEEIDLGEIDRLLLEEYVQKG